MKIQQLLEAEIKVPQTSVDEIMSVVLSALFSRLMTILENLDMEDYQIELDKIIKRYMNIYEPFEVYDNFNKTTTLSNKIRFPLKELPDRYFMKRMVKHARILNVRVEIGDKDIHGSVELHNKPITITIYLPNDEKLHKMIHTMKFIPTLIKQLESVVRHELMHVVQKLIWNKFPDDEEVNYYNTNDELDYDKYFSHEEEFGPLIYSHYGVIKAHQDIMEKSRGRKLTHKEKNDLFRNYVKPSKAPQTPSETFFDHLYNKQRPKWKKAVKELYGLFMRD